MKIINFDIIDSTQLEARRRLDKIDQNTVIVAKEQTAGVGKPGTVWHSVDGGLYFSLIIIPKKDLLSSGTFTHDIAESVSKVLKIYGIVATIKMPNDLLVDGKKICGILTENSKGKLIIGVGLNVNNIDFPNGLEATSMRLLTGKKFEVEGVLGRILAQVENDFGLISNDT